MVREAFSRAAAKPAGSSGNGFVEAILRERPDLRGKTAYVEDGGGNAHIVFIGEEVFKGPKSKYNVSGFDQECAMTQELSDKNPLVPKVTCVGKESFFFGMTPMPGIALGQDFCDRLHSAELRALARDIIGFIVSMALALPKQDGKFALHNDLNHNNVRIDSGTRKLSAVIDFGSIDYYPKELLASKIRLGTADFKRMLCEEYALRMAELLDLTAIKDAAPSAGKEACP